MRGSTLLPIYLSSLIIGVLLLCSAVVLNIQWAEEDHSFQKEVKCYDSRANEIVGAVCLEEKRKESFTLPEVLATSGCLFLFLSLFCYLIAGGSHDSNY